MEILRSKHRQSCITHTHTGPTKIISLFTVQTRTRTLLPTRTEGIAKTSTLSEPQPKELCFGIQLDLCVVRHWHNECADNRQQFWLQQQPSNSSRARAHS